MKLGELLLRARLGAPIVTLLLFLCCVVATLPVAIDPQLYFVLGADAPTMRWWHPFVTPFVHGGGWPGTWPHLAINSAILLVFGGLMERVLGSFRFWLITVFCFLLWVVIMFGTGYEGNGFSGVTWSYWIVVAPALWRAARTHRARALLDPVTWVALPFFLFLVAGTIKWTHTVPAMVAFPFALAWWKDVHDNLDAIERGETPERESPRQRRIAVAATAAMLLFQIAMAVLGLTGRLEV